MSTYGDISIKFKLRFIIMATSTLAVLLVSAGILFYEFIKDRNSLTEELLVLSRIVGDRVTAAIDFNDSQAAHETLSALAAKKSIVEASIYTRSGALLANIRHRGPSMPSTPPLLPENSCYTKNGYLYVFQAIVIDNNKIGTVYLCADLQETYTRYKRYLYIVAAFVLVSLCGAYFLSSRLQKVITEPIEYLARTSNTIAEHKDYSLRAKKQSNDEVGLLIDSFNEMLSQIQNKDVSLQESEERFRRAIVDAPFPIMIHAEDGQVLQISKVWTDITGYAPHDISTIGRWTEKAYGERKDIVKRDIDRLYALNEKVHEKEYTLRTRAGKKIIWDFSSAPLGKLPDGRRLVISMAMDVTDRKNTEEQLRQSQKMESVGTLAGGVAHEFNNILGGIFNYLQLAKDDAAENGAVQDSLDETKRLAERAADIIQQILSFSRKDRSKKIRVQPHRLIKEELKILRATIPTTVAIKADIDEQSGTIIADQTQIKQVVMNLCNNAAHAMQKQGGVLTITLSPAFLDAEDIALYPDLTNPGDYVQLTIRDNGTGIDPEIKDKIFDPFFTTKAVGKGTGMGLSVVHGIVRDHGGVIAVSSSVGHGTTFTIMLPRTDGEVGENKEADQLPTGTENILLVDDEEALVFTQKKILERLGYNVTAMTSSLETLALFKKDPRGYDLIITDLTMPHMTGDRLASKITAIRPDMPVILATGYADAVDDKNIQQSNIKTFISKPCRKQDLAKTIRLVLDEK
ncbi:ATP-binding protein [Thermodesulfobacteriota bacterium]